ncbi:hypothetical protein F5B21DRAFT_109868 [Xylaria acuta]|nr:hypothetical protein F5B21DRAFT_109868 [Xylaria acuta]
MFRPGIHHALFRDTALGKNGYRRPTLLMQSRYTHNESSEQTSPSSSDGPSQPKPKPERRPVNPATVRWTSVMDPRPRIPIGYQNYQDVRDRGPLFNLAKIELDPNPENAKQQWRNLCVEQEQKQKIANELWETNKELEVRCHCAEAKHENTKEVLQVVSRARKELEADNVRLVAEVQRTRKVMRELRQTQEKQQAAVPSWKDWSAGQASVFVLIAKATVMGLFTIAVVWALVSITNLF